MVNKCKISAKVAGNHKHNGSQYFNNNYHCKSFIAQPRGEVFTKNSCLKNPRHKNYKGDVIWILQSLGGSGCLGGKLESIKL